MRVTPTCLFPSYVCRLDDGHVQCVFAISQIWTVFPQVFSALTMLFPALHGYSMAPDIAADASFPPGSAGTSMKILDLVLPPWPVGVWHGFLHIPGVWALLYATLFHCPVSMAYHLANAAFDGHLGTEGGTIVRISFHVVIFGAYHARKFAVPKCAEDVRVWCLEHTIPDCWPSSHPSVQLGWCDDGDGFYFGMSIV